MLDHAIQILQAWHFNFLHLKQQRFIFSNLYHSSLLFFCSNHCFIGFVQMRLKKNGKKNRVKYGCWQFDFIYIIPFILKWPYNIYSILIYVLSIFGMVNGLSISFLNSKVSFLFFSFFLISFHFCDFLYFPNCFLTVCIWNPFSGCT